MNILGVYRTGLFLSVAALSTAYTLSAATHPPGGDHSNLSPSTDAAATDSTRFVPSQYNVNNNTLPPAVLSVAAKQGVITLRGKWPGWEDRRRSMESLLDISGLVQIV